MKSKDKKTPEAQAAERFYSLSQFSSKPSPQAGEPDAPLSKVSLRQKAESQFREREEMSSEKLDALSPETLRTILHELRVHQIELELQNEELRVAQANPDASRSKYFDLYDLAPVGYITVSEAGLILAANLTATTMLGLGRPALVTRPVSRFIHKEDQGIYYKMQKPLMETREPHTCELRLMKSDGTAIWTHLEATFSQNESGEPACRLTFNDISGRKHTEELMRGSEARYRELVNNLEAGVVVHAPDTSVIMSNSRALELLGLSEGQMTGRLAMDPDWKFLHEDHTPFLLEEYPVNRVIAEKKAIKDLVLGIVRSASKDIIWVSVNAAAVFDQQGDIREVVISFVDITKRKKTEEAMLVAKEAAESATRAKGEFLAMMTHELRTPLNGMMGFSELLSDTPLNDEQREYAQTISSSGEHLLGIINDILDFSSMEHGRLYLHSAPFSLAGTLESSMLSVRKSALKKGLDLHSETGSEVPERMTGDERRVRQILINLLGNAVKFTSAGSVVLRVAASTSGNQPAVDFSVEDTGLGISAEALGRLFQPFTQASSAIGRSFGGTGLGLSISRRLAEAMNGTVTVTSTLGKGSIFTLRLPLEVPAGGMASVPSHLFIGADGASPSSPSAEPLARPVLVVDDDRASGVVAVKMLQNLGHQVEFVTNGAEAIEAFSPGKYSAIFMDVAMPVMDGFVATGKIREIEEATGYHVPIIAFTAQAMHGDRERCLAAGMDDFLAKPFKGVELAAKLANVMQR